MTNEPNTNVPERGNLGSWTCADCNLPRVMDKTATAADFLCRYCFSTNGIPPDAPVHNVATPQAEARELAKGFAGVRRRASDKDKPTEPQRRTNSVPETCVEHCGWCNQDYDFFTQSIHCPHNVKPQPAAPAVSELGAFWQQWFQDVGAHGTMAVIHATTKLVIAEREIAVRDHLEPIRKALMECEFAAGLDQSNNVSLYKPDWDALVALVKENHDGK